MISLEQSGFAVATAFTILSIAVSFGAATSKECQIHLLLNASSTLKQ